MPKFTKEQRIIDGLSETNKWWKTGFRIDYLPRLIYDDLLKYLPLRQILVLTGLRRVGKTTLMLKMILDRIEAGFDPKRILYFTFDDFQDVRLADVLDSYHRLFGHDPDQGEFLLFLDEVQKLRNWEEQVKRIYDLRPGMKIVISGSESLFIRKKSRESLSGRFFEFHIRQLTFREYLSFKNAPFEPMELYRKEILYHFSEYAISNGFPEMVGKERDIVDKYIRENVLEKIIFRDIPSMFGVRDPAVLFDVYRVVMQRPGAIIEMDSFSRDFGVSRQTLSLYLQYLENSFLIRKLYNFSRNARKTQRKLKKYYPAVLAPALLDKPEMAGPAFETVMVNLLGAEYFWRDAYKNEVDVILMQGEKIMPVEIKYSPEKPKPLLLFMKKFKCQRGIMLTYDTEIRWGAVEAVPFYKYLLGEKTMEDGT